MELLIKTSLPVFLLFVSVKNRGVVTLEVRNIFSPYTVKEPIGEIRRPVCLKAVLMETVARCVLHQSVPITHQIQREPRPKLESPMVTHAHPEGQAGAMAVAAMAAIVSSPIQPIGIALLREVLSYVPASKTREGIVEATRIDPNEHQRAIAVLGTGDQVAAFDTVPYCFWIVAHHAQDYETALWTTVAGLGDRDTTCAIVGGIVALSTNIPSEWLKRREALPRGFEV